MSWRLAKALLKLRDQVNGRWPNRSRDSDGSIGDTSHSSRTSDHNPNDAGVVCAIDLTHDPRSGFDSYAFAEVLRTAKDRRIGYLISNRRICSSTVEPWKWRHYSGVNPHDHHIHISVQQDASLYDDEALWSLDGSPMPKPSNVVPVAPRTLQRGDSGEAVRDLQGMLNGKGIQISVDGVFGQATYAGLKRFQSARGLIADGICGPQTWAALAK